MNFYPSLTSSLMCLLTIFGIQMAEATFSNNGRMHSKNLNLSTGGTLDNNGELIGTETAKISCGTLTGNGLISSPQIFLETQIFAYTGIIDCGGKCMINTSAPFDESMFKRKGDGEFIIIVNPNLECQTQFNTVSPASGISLGDDLSGGLNLFIK